ncbi:DNA-3-methyladenine glycosylase I [Tenacibaculum piscium]|uniref:DNA-3-methyladenine glycosylase I n=1 Tax=Tenacibaculum piscium TaxID=1458515 RepID=A0A2H1YIP8_9FLAO|nr:DNA-3-methyladenine glycosylase I [Tenacibaculum piscium]MBE7628594.1 DNA-3-methyladenine glycosylase I [Tenacibaculum piscium]MBE7669735.1 DNA-3-methyladenine glycosylase I [Tenacibaculum piscium]MBE7684677.1 DNA-3-methyladenine glycosylase I [Tenacibaculum piscium]MBE7689297.1 DNA-3-methyladenine glycosylase I [Tenacibaculum piscium]SOS75384.1 DNA-3-methyladenine glycosylase [Tenacibaculum piscium]
MKKRCLWVGNNPLYIKYHDTEWGVPVYDDAVLFEFLLLESFQAGLNWITILKKRENFRSAFDNFDYTKIANYDEYKYDELLQNVGIVRHKLKIKSAILNAKLFMEVQKEFGSFSAYIWSFVAGKPIKNNFKNSAEVPASTALSDTISKDLKKRGFKFVGATIIYAYMQAIGMVNDHTTSCFKYSEF